MSNDSTFPDSKRCTKCGEEKPREIFGKSSRNKSGLRTECNDCRRVYRQENTEKLSEKARHNYASKAARETILTPLEKQCIQCLEVKPSDAFTPHKGNLDGLNSTCKSCRNVRETAHRREQGMLPHNYNIAKDGIKRCSRCEQLKPVDAFGKDKNRSDGLFPHCFDCKRADRIRTANNPRPSDDLIRQCIKCGEVKFLKMFPPSRAYKDGVSTRCKTCAYRETRAYQSSAPEKKREALRRLRSRHPDRYRAHDQKRRALKKSVGGRGITEQDIQAMIYCQQGLCAYCERDGQKLTLDHVIPLDQNGPHDPDNAVMCCLICNSSKGHRTPEEWTDRWYLR